MKIADAMLIGGGMAYTFLKSQGLPIGKSLVENDKLDLARKLACGRETAKFPAAAAVDHVLRRNSGRAETHTTDISATPDD